MRSKLLTRYILSEMIPTFFIGVIVFVFILLMFQALRLTEFVLVHGVKVTTVLEMMGYLSTSFLSILFPMSLLFTVILTYGRLSVDSEIVALRATGLSMASIAAPTFIMSILICLLSLQTSFYIAPWGNRQFEVLVTKLGAAKPGVTIKEGTFSEGFFNLVVYANTVDSKSGSLQNVFIYDERESDSAITVVARKGKIIQDPNNPGNAALLRLSDGNIHRISGGRHTKIDFNTYDLQLFEPLNDATKKKSPPSLNLADLGAILGSAQSSPEQKRQAQIELHKRIAIGFACLLFGIIGVGLGTVTNKRNVKSSGAVVSIGLIIIYWALYLAGESLAQGGQLPPWLAMWLANFAFSIAGIFFLKRAWNG